MTEQSTTCAVVGGGPAGMILGLLLARAGVEVTVFEKHPDFLRDFRGDTVHPVTIRLLDELGLYSRFLELPLSKMEKISFTVDGHVLTMVDFSGLKIPHSYMAFVPQWDLLDMLATAAQQEPAFTLRMQTEVTGLLFDGDAVAGVRYLGPDGPGELQADLTVACDGRTSVVRQAARLIPREFDVSFDVAWFRLDAVEGATYSLSPRMIKDIALILLPRVGYFQVGCFIPKGGEPALRDLGLETFRARVAEAVPEADAESLTSWDDVKVLDVRVNRLHRWHRDGLLCIGDAAHAMSPAGGVGINLAIQDAVATARILAGPLLSHRLTTGDLAAVRRRRNLPAAVTQRFQLTAHRFLMPIILRRSIKKTPHIVITAAASLLSRMPWLAVLPARFVGVGLRAEHVPLFAQRPDQP